MIDKNLCCTKYNKNNVTNGYIVLKILPVNICNNCKEARCDSWSHWQLMLWKGLFMHFWNGKIHLISDSNDL